MGKLTNIMVYQSKRVQFHRTGLVQQGTMVPQAAYKRDQPFFFQLLADHPQHLVAILEIDSAGGWIELSGNGIDNGVFILLCADVSFENADHVSELNTFTQNSYPAPF